MDPILSCVPPIEDLCLNNLKMNDIFFFSNWSMWIRVSCQLWECLIPVWIRSQPSASARVSFMPSWPGQEAAGLPSPWSRRSIPRLKCPRSKTNSRVRGSNAGTRTSLETESSYIRQRVSFHISRERVSTLSQLHQHFMSAIAPIKI